MFRRLFSLVPPACSLLGSLIVAVWLASRIATDRWVISELLFWVPSPAYLIPAIALSLAGALPLRRRRSSRVAAASLLAAAAALAWLFLFEWRLPRALSMPEPPAPGHAIRIVHWNLASVDRSFRPDILDALADEDGRPADVLCLGALLDNARLKSALDRLGPEYSATRIGPFVLVSRVPFSGVVAETLRLPSPSVLAEEAITGEPLPADAGPFRLPLVQKLYNRASRYMGFQRRDLAAGEPGTLIRFRLDTTAALGRPVTVWWIDLPSSPLAPRYTLAKTAAERIAQIRAQPGVEAPDILLGDFNIPLGSASLSLIAHASNEPLVHAADQASYGPLASWPHQHPIWLIDHLFAAPPLAVTRYQLLDPGVSEHRAQAATITTREGR